MFAISLAPEVKWMGIDVLAVHPSPVASRWASTEQPQHHQTCTLDGTDIHDPPSTGLLPFAAGSYAHYTCL